MWKRNGKQAMSGNRREERRYRKGRRWHTMERLESRCVLAATIAGQIFDDLNGDQIWQPAAPQHEPALHCWTVYLDANKNGALDPGEPQQLSGSDGSYSFEVPGAGDYSIGLVQEPGYDRTKPIRFGLTTNLLSGSVADHAFDPTRNVLYAADGDRVLRINPKTGETLAALSFGTSLHSLDVTPDGKFLLAGEAGSDAGNGKLYKVDLATNAITTISFAVAGPEGGVFDLAAVSNDRVLFTTSSSSTDRVALREVNLTNSAVSTRAETFGAGAGEVLPGSRLERNASRSALVLVSSTGSAGSVHLYDQATNAFVRSADFSESLTDAHLAISRDGKKIAVESSGLGLKVLDETLAEVRSLPHFRGGVAFDSARNILYAGDTVKDELVAIDSNTGSELYRVAVGEDLPATGLYYEMQVQGRARHLSLTTPAGVRYVQLDRPIAHHVTVTDGQAVTGIDFGNWINGENRRPQAIDNSYTIAEDETLSVSAPGVLGNDTDPDGTPLQAQLVSGPQNGVLTLSANGAVLYQPNSNFFGTDSFTYRAHDGSVGSCRAATVQLNVTPVNDPPATITLNSNVVDENSSGAEIGQIVVVDPDPQDQITLQVSDERFEIVDGRLRLREGKSLDHEQGSSIDITVTATDNGTPPRSTTQIFTIHVQDINEFDPVVETTIIEVAEGGSTVGTVQTRDQDSSQTLQTTIVGGNDAGIFSIDPNTGVITVNTGHQLDHEGTQVHVLTIQVEDSVAPRRSTSSTVTISITDVNEHDPVLTTTTLQVPENSAAGTVVGTVVASDADTSQSVIYSISGGNGSGIFSIDPSTGKITVVDGTQLDAEASGSIVLTISMTDSGVPARTAAGDVTVQITNVNEFEPILSEQSVRLAENAPNDTVVTTLSAFDPDVQSDLVFSISGGNIGGVFTIDGQTGTLRVANSSVLDAETNPTITLEVTVTDNSSPPRSSTGTVTITLDDVNEFDPVLASSTMRVASDAPVGFEVGGTTATDQDQSSVLTYEITDGNGQGIFAIDPSSGAITVVNNAPLTSAEGSPISLTVRASDGGTPVRTAEAQVVVNVVPPNTNPPTAQDAVFTVAENSSAGTVVGTVSASDPDAGSSITFNIESGNDGGIFAIDSTTGQITVANATGLNYESVQKITLSVLVNDGGTPAKTATAQITIDLTDVNEFAPTLSDLTSTLAENAANGTVVGTALASDQDSRQTIRYSISGTAFAIHPTSGQITVADASQLDFEAASSLEATITATDSGSPEKSTTAKLTVSLTDVNEAAPVLASKVFSLDENPAAGAAVGRVTATDADTKQTLTYELVGGNTGGAFAIDASTGEITVAKPALLDAEALPQLQLQVRVSDNGSPARTATATVQVDVHSINEAPTGVQLAGNVVPENLSGARIGVVVVSDQDVGDIHTLTVDDPRFTIDSGRNLRLRDGVSLDVSEGVTIPLRITATDAGGLSTSQNVTISVEENPTPWQNPSDPLDVNGDGVVTPSDVLRVINEINAPKSTDLRGRLPSERPDIPDTPFYDVNGDGQLSPIDVLIIVNELNRRSANNAAEGEAGYADTPAKADPRQGWAFAPASASRSQPLASWAADDSDDEDDLESTLDALAPDISSMWSGAGQS